MITALWTAETLVVLIFIVLVALLIATARHRH
jgi:hypothetical protein